MALKKIVKDTQVGVNEFGRKLAEMEVGESVSGYLVSTFVPKAVAEEGRNDKAIVLRDKTTGKNVFYYTAGTLKYDVNDDALALNQFTVITATGKQARKAKNGKAYKLSTFEVQQDDEDVYSPDDSPAFKALEAEEAKATPATAQKAGVQNAILKAQVAALREQAKGK